MLEFEVLRCQMGDGGESSLRMSNLGLALRFWCRRGLGIDSLSDFLVIKWPAYNLKTSFPEISSNAAPQETLEILY